MSIVIPSLGEFGWFVYTLDKMAEGGNLKEWGSFEGFIGEERELNYRLCCRKNLHMEEMMDKLLERIKTLEAHQKETGVELVIITAKLMEIEDKNEKIKV